MKPRYEIVEARPIHLSMVANRLRDDDRAEIIASGRVPRHVLYDLWRNSTHRWAAFVDGDIACVGGCTGILLSSVGHPWLFTTAAIERVPMAFAKEAKRWLIEVLTVKSSLVTSCHASYEKSVRFWSMLGFKMSDPVALGNGAMFRHMTMERDRG